MPIIGGLLSLLGNAVGGFFGMKQAQGEAVQGAINAISTVAESDMEQANAAATAIAALYQNGTWLERSWRPLFMYVVVGMVISNWFGYQPPHMTVNQMDHLYNFLYIGLGGYMPLRSLDKWMMGFQIGGILKTYIAKKVA